MRTFLALCLTALFLPTFALAQCGDCSSRKLCKPHKASLAKALKYFKEDFGNRSSDTRIQAIRDLCETTSAFRSVHPKKAIKVVTAGLDDPHEDVRAASIRGLSILADPESFVRMMDKQASRWLQNADKLGQKIAAESKIQKRDKLQLELTGIESDLEALVELLSLIEHPKARSRSVDLLASLLSPQITFGENFRLEALHLLTQHASPTAVAALAHLLTTYLGLPAEHLKNDPVVQKLMQETDKALRALAKKHSIEAPTSGQALDGAWETFANEYAAHLGQDD